MIEGFIYHCVFYPQYGCVLHLSRSFNLFRRPCRGQCRPNFTSIRSVRSDGPWSASVAWQFREISCILCLWVLLSNRLEWVSETWWPDHHTSISLAVLISRTPLSYDRNLLAAKFSSHDSWVIGGYSMVIWCSNIHVWIFFCELIFMFDCWSLIWLWTCCIYVHSWFRCFRFEVPLSIDIDIFSIWWFRFRCIDFSLSVSFSSISFPYRFWVKKYDMKW
jgi:hypothetical protein